MADKTRQLKQREHQKAHYAKNKEYYKNKRMLRRKSVAEKLAKYKSTLTCALCPENMTCALDFHHKDPATKDGLIARLVDYGSWNKIVAEIMKCYCLCANCHRKVHTHAEWADKLLNKPTLLVSDGDG